MSSHKTDAYQQQYIDLALQYAEQRWKFTDAARIRLLCEQALANEFQPELCSMVDQFAETVKWVDPAPDGRMPRDVYNSVHDIKLKSGELWRSQRKFFSEQSFEHLLNTLVLLPVHPYHSELKSLTSFKDDDQMTFSMPLGDAIQRSGVPVAELADTLQMTKHPQFRASFDQDARETIVYIGSVYGSEGKLSERYSFSVNRDGQMNLRLWKISRDRHIGNLNENQMERLTQKASELIAKRQLEIEKAQSQTALTAKEFVANVASAPKKAAGKPKNEKVTTLEEELGLLTAESDRIVLPKTPLNHYDAIKDLMLKAGGAYKSKNKSSFFSFDEGIDPHSVLNSLLSGEVINVKQETQFFGTPTVVGNEALETLGNIWGKRILEPSAGDGALADLARAKEADVFVIENYEVLDKDFLSVSPQETGTFDAVLMNPPFSNRQDIAHILHALSFLNGQGELTAIMSPQFQTAKFKASENFKALMELAQAEITPIAKGAFQESGTAAGTVRVHLKVDKLLAALDKNNESDETYGIDLSRARAHLQKNESVKPMKLRA
jgi:hypothetical protein